MTHRGNPYETEASRLRGTNAYFRSEEVWEEESYYNGWDRDAFKRWADTRTKERDGREGK